MSSPEIQRRVRQQGADIESLYELVSAVDLKVDALGEQMEQQGVAMNAKLDAILELLGRQA